MGSQVFGQALMDSCVDDMNRLNTHMNIGPSSPPKIVKIVGILKITEGRRQDEGCRMQEAGGRRQEAGLD